MNTSQSEPGRGERSPRPRLPIQVSAVTLALSTYCLLLLTRLIDASILTRDNEYFSVIVLQMIIFLLPGFAYCQWRGAALRERLRVRMFRVDHILFLLGAILSLVSGSILLQMLSGSAQLAGESFSLYDTFISKNSGSVENTLYLVVAYAALPAFCEELIFRGIFCAEYERHGAVCASMMSMIFFAMLHFDFRHILLYLFSAALLCAVLYATRSLIAAMVVHFCYNLFGLFGVPYLGAVYQSLGRGGIWLFVFIWIVLFLIGASLFCGEAARLYRGYAMQPTQEERGVRPMGVRDSAIRFLRWMVTPQVLVCLLLYVIVILVQAVK